MVTATNPQFRSKISSLLEELLAAAVTEICELFDTEFAALRVECSRCKHSEQARRQTLISCNSSSENINTFTVSVDDPHGRRHRGDFELATNGNSGTTQTIPQCSQWDMGVINKQSKAMDSPKHVTKPMDTKMEMVCVKQEVLEESELQREERSGQEAGSDIALPDPNQDLGTSLSPQTGLDWSPAPELFIHSDNNCDLKLESGNGRSSSTSKDESNSGHDGRDYCGDQQKLSTWNMTVDEHHALHADIMHPRDCTRDGREMEAQSEETEIENTHFTQWTVSPLRSPAYLHKQWSKCRKPPGSVNVCSMSLSGAVSLDVRVDGSGNQLNMPLTVSADQEKRFTCPLCGKRLLSEQTLKSHQKIHTGYAPHQCNQCGKRFSRLENLKVHQNIHTGLKPYTCKFCLKKFNAPSNFNRHKRACLKRKLAQFSSQ
ncbi:hypothetical protein ACEWY4_019249 [Coilia grayii]|uniref:C2H2-type domain-containing protein n=1 Tax=Coilia grayii TaxID=363190 RepID=A0ABD1JGP3_9TELE